MCSILRDFDFDVFCISETWLHPNTPSGNYAIPGYIMLRSDRQNNQAIDRQVGGGVALYLKEGLCFEQYCLSEEIDPGVEHLCVILKWKGVRVGLCVVYRPSYVRSSCLAELFRSLFVDLAVQVNSVIYLGDTNIDLLSEANNDAKYFRRLLRDSNAIQIVNEPTRVTAISATLIDHIVVDRSVEVKRTGVVDAASIKDHRGQKITDHKLVYCEICVPKEKPLSKLITYRDFSKFDPMKAVESTSSINWNTALEKEGVDAIEQSITTNIRKVFDEHAPLVCKRVSKKKAPWRSEAIKELTKIKNNLRHQYWRTRLDADWNEYKTVRNMLNKLVWKAKKDYFSDNLVSSKSPMEFWRSLRKCDIVHDKMKNSLPDSFEVNDMNTYFVEMGSGLEVDKDLLLFFESNKKCGNNSFKFKAVTEEDVICATNAIKSKAMGTDDVSIQMIKAVSPYAIKAITHLMNESLRSGTFPNTWKMSIVHPMPKKTNPTSVQHLRPISILPAMSKILEKLVIRQMNEYINEQNLLPKLQSGFRRNFSTCSALTNLFSDLFQAKDCGLYSSLVFLDYSQAFDSINHDMLLAKMCYMGFDETPVSWVKSYLESRQQVTKLGSKTSSPLSKQRGVPQGTCLGPLLFNLYTSDVTNCIQSCKAHLYADDCQLHLSYKPVVMDLAINEINADLQNISEWSVKNGLKLNVNKCNVLHVAPQNSVDIMSDRGFNVKLNNESLSVCSTVKTLGVVLDSELTFTPHVTHAIQRALGRLRGLYRFRDLLPESTKFRLMQSLVLSVFQYCYPSYGNSISRENITRIQKMQNTAIRFIFQLKRYDHVTPFRDAVNLLPMEDICKILTGCMTKKILKLREPEYLYEKLVYREEVSHQNTRQDKTLHLPRVRLEVGRKGYSYFGPKLYNGLPANIKECHSIIKFKSIFKHSLLNK